MDKSVKEDLNIFMKMMMDSNEIINDLPFRIWIETRNHERNTIQFLQAEYIKDKIKPIKKPQSIKAENLFTLSIDSVNPDIISAAKSSDISSEDISLLKDWIVSNFEELMELWNNKRKVILGYPLKLKTK